MQQEVNAEAFKPLPTIIELVDEARKFNLLGVDIFDKLTIEELIEQYNGVGPDRFPKYIRDILSSLLRDALPAVAIHDMDYYIGGTKEQFHAANKRLCTNTRILATKKFKWWQLRRWKLYFIAPVLKRATEKYGIEGWRLRENEKTDKKMDR